MLVANSKATPNAVVTPAAITPTPFQMASAALTSPQAKAKLPTTIANISTIGLFSLIQSPNLLNPFASPFKASTITPPVQDAIGCKNSSHSQAPKSIKTSSIGLSTLNAPDNKLKNAGNASSIVHSASGLNMLSINHFRIFPKLFTIGVTELFKFLKEFISGVKLISLKYLFILSSKFFIELSTALVSTGGATNCGILLFVPAILALVAPRVLISSIAASPLTSLAAFFALSP